MFEDVVELIPFKALLHFEEHLIRFRDFQCMSFIGVKLIEELKIVHILSFAVVSKAFDNNIDVNISSSK